MTVTNPAAAGFVTVWPCGAPPPRRLQPQLRRRPERPQPRHRQTRHRRQGLLLLHGRHRPHCRCRRLLPRHLRLRPHHQPHPHPRHPQRHRHQSRRRRRRRRRWEWRRERPHRLLLHQGRRATQRGLVPDLRQPTGNARIARRRPGVRALGRLAHRYRHQQRRHERLGARPAHRVRHAAGGPAPSRRPDLQRPRGGGGERRRGSDHPGDVPEATLRHRRSHGDGRLRRERQFRGHPRRVARVLVDGSAGASPARHAHHSTAVRSQQLRVLPRRSVHRA